MDLKSMIAQAAGPHMQAINTALDDLRKAVEAANEAGFAVDVIATGPEEPGPGATYMREGFRAALASNNLTAALQYSATVREQA